MVVCLRVARSIDSTSCFTYLLKFYRMCLFRNKSQISSEPTTMLCRRRNCFTFHRSQDDNSRRKSEHCQQVVVVMHRRQEETRFPIRDGSRTSRIHTPENNHRVRIVRCVVVKLPYKKRLNSGWFGWSMSTSKSQRDMGDMVIFRGARDYRYGRREESSSGQLALLRATRSPTPCHPLFLGDDPASNVAVDRLRSVRDRVFDNIVWENSIPLSLPSFFFFLFWIDRPTHVARWWWLKWKMDIKRILSWNDCI